MSSIVVNTRHQEIVSEIADYTIEHVHQIQQYLQSAQDAGFNLTRNENSLTRIEALRTVEVQLAEAQLHLETVKEKSEAALQLLHSLQT